MLLKVLNILYNCHDNCLHLICVWEYMNYTFYPNCIIMIIMKYKYGAIYLGRPENREGVVWKFRTNPDRGRGVVCQKPDVRKIQKSEKQIQKLFDNVQLYHCIHMYFSTVFTNLQMSGDSQRLLGDYLR